MSARLQPEDLRVEYVEWIDSAGGGRWTPLTEIAQDSYAVCRTVGFLLCEDDSTITLVSSVDLRENDDDAVQHGDNWTVIPQVAVRLRHSLGGVPHACS